MTKKTGQVLVTEGFLAIFGRLLGRVPVRMLTSNFHHRTLRNKAHKIRDIDYDFGVQFSPNWMPVFLLNSQFCCLSSQSKQLSRLRTSGSSATASATQKWTYCVDVVQGRPLLLPACYFPFLFFFFFNQKTRLYRSGQVYAFFASGNGRKHPPPPSQSLFAFLSKLIPCCRHLSVFSGSFSKLITSLKTRLLWLVWHAWTVSFL